MSREVDGGLEVSEAVEGFVVCDIERADMLAEVAAESLGDAERAFVRLDPGPVIDAVSDFGLADSAPGTSFKEVDGKGVDIEVDVSSDVVGIEEVL